MHIQVDMPYTSTGYDITNYILSEARETKPSKMPPQTASGGISGERVKQGSPNFKQLSGITGPTNVPDMTSLITSGRLQNAIKYCTKEMRKTGPAGQPAGQRGAKLFGRCLT